MKGQADQWVTLAAVKSDRLLGGWRLRMACASCQVVWWLMDVGW